MVNYESRKKLIEELQRKRDSVIITYFALTDRPNVPPLLIEDGAIMPLHTLLEQVGHKKAIDFFICTRGGSMMSAYSIVKMFREYSDKFSVLIPFRAHSAGTQIALGADEIVMSKIGQLSPVDPSTANFFNPLLVPQGNPADLRNRKSISVEDVQSYLNLAKDRVGLVSESDQLEVFKELTRCYEPLALGNVARVYTETRVIAKEMLSLHMDAEKDEEKIEWIVKALTEEYTHDFLITRDIAKKVGLKVVMPSPEEESLMMKIYESYESEMKTNTPLDVEYLLSGQQSVGPPSQPMPPNPKKFRLKLGAIESASDSFIWISEGIAYPPLAQIIPQVMAQPGQYPPVPSIRLLAGTWSKSPEAGGEFA
jgi:ATP-dependent protease ClpP protease subunit